MSSLIFPSGQADAYDQRNLCTESILIIPPILCQYVFF